MLWATLATLAVAVLAPGCGPKYGALLYFAGMGQDQKTPAEFELPAKALLILVDDDYGLIQPPIARDALVEAVARELRDHGVAEKITSNEELARLRQSTPDFEKRCADAVGKMANAEVVLWLQVVRFTIPDDIDAAMVPCYYGVTVKVLDATATKREDVRLWPKEREGKTVEVTISPHDLQQAKSIREAHTLAAETLAVDVARLFYEYKTEQNAR